MDKNNIICLYVFLQIIYSMFNYFNFKSSIRIIYRTYLKSGLDNLLHNNIIMYPQWYKLKIWYFFTVLLIISDLVIYFETLKLGREKNRQTIDVSRRSVKVRSSIRNVTPEKVTCTICCRA